MSSKKAAFAGLLGAAVLSLGIPGAAAAAGDSSTQAALNCKTSVGNTSGWAECKGKGTWRVRSVCDNETDKWTGWISQRSGTNRVYAEECTWDIEDVLVEMK